VLNPPVRAVASLVPQVVAGSYDAILTPMQLSTITRITPEQFFAWVSAQEERYELVDGEVVMMAGAGRRHDRVVVNLTTPSIRSRLERK
jgi:Uma2 family endonuclease